MVMLIWSENEPPELLAQTVYVTAVVCKDSGVPEMAPVAVLNESPVGKVGWIAHEVAVPPVVDGVVVVIVCSRVSV